MYTKQEIGQLTHDNSNMIYAKSRFTQEQNIQVFQLKFRSFIALLAPNKEALTFALGYITYRTLNTLTPTYEDLYSNILLGDQKMLQEENYFAIMVQHFAKIIRICQIQIPNCSIG